MTQLPVLDPHAAFVDVGSEQMHVSIAGGTPVVFGTVTSQLHALHEWLVRQGVRSVAMEATGVYWLPLYGVLEAGGLQVFMVNGRQTKNLPGRKTDMADCQWGATLHAHGLLRPGFVPPANIRRLQDYVRLRDDHITQAAGCIQLMQKALERMNVKLHEVISDLGGASGLAVVRAILAGEHNPEKLLSLCDARIRKAKAERVKEALRGTWAQEHLFALRQALQSFEHFQRLVAECDREIQALLPEPPADGGGAGPSKGRKYARGNAPRIAGLNKVLQHMCGGRDPTILPALADYTVLRLISEVGTDLSKWPTEKHFTSWTGLAPGSKQSGKRHGKVKRSRNRVGRLLCVVARSLAKSKDIALGGFYRRMAARRGGLLANIALARKLAALFWRFMVKGPDFVELGLAQYEAKVLETKRRTLNRLAKEFGHQLIPNPNPWRFQT